MPYYIYRFYSDDRRPLLRESGLTEEQAKKWCNDPETSSRTSSKGRAGVSCNWFEGFTDKKMM